MHHTSTNTMTHSITTPAFAPQPATAYRRLPARQTEDGNLLVIAIDGLLRIPSPQSIDCGMRVTKKASVAFQKASYARPQSLTTGTTNEPYQMQVVQSDIGRLHRLIG